MPSNADGFRISRFLAEVLGAKVVNERQSWGSESKETRAVFLRVWEDHRVGNTIQVWWPETTNPFGQRERREQLDMMERGQPTFGIVCVKWPGREEKSRKIKDFNHKKFLRLGLPLNYDNCGIQYAHIEEEVGLNVLLSASGNEAAAGDDLNDIKKRKLVQTTKDALVKARLGQGQFRTDLLGLWGGRCALTGSTTHEAIRASHILAWKLSTDDQRLDALNGLPLNAGIDALFDRFLVTFEDDGTMTVSKSIPQSERTLLGLDGRKLGKILPAETKGYLAHHRKVFKKREAKRTPAN